MDARWRTRLPCARAQSAHLHPGPNGGLVDCDPVRYVPHRRAGRRVSNVLAEGPLAETRSGRVRRIRRITGSVRSDSRADSAAFLKSRSAANIRAARESQLWDATVPL